MSYRSRWISTFLFLIMGSQLLAQEPLVISRLDSPIVFDGSVDEAAWEHIAPLPVTVYAPTFGADPTERTEIRIAYDDDYLYVSGRLFDSDSDGVRTNTLYRDAYRGDDLFAIVIDSFNDNETAVWFSINPAGVRTDRTIANDARVGGGADFGRGLNSNWNAFWDAATTQTPEGWFAELRIPFSSLGFQEVNGRVVMGFIAYRLIARKAERHIFPAIPPNWRMGFAKPSQARRIVLSGVHRRTPVYITPYALGGVATTPALNAARTAFQTDRDPTTEAGLDVRYAASSSVTVDLTVNTDFAQVEADNQQINLTRFSLFFPEKRQFFQERASVFEFGTGRQSRVFHSRRIGLVDGKPIRILGGVRGVARTGGTDIGTLVMQTAATDGLPSENFGVARIRQRVLNPYSTVGGIVTSRVDLDGRYNVVVGADARLRPVGDEYVTFRVAKTFETDAPNTVTDLDATRIVAQWERRTLAGFNYRADFIRSGTGYDPGIGFVVRRDFSLYAGQSGYSWFPGTASVFRRLSVSGRGEAYVRNTDRTAESALLRSSLSAELKQGNSLSLSVVRTYESVRDTFELAGGPAVPPGDYWFNTARFNLRWGSSGVLRPSGSVAYGSFYDGWRATFRLAPEWNPSRYFELGAEYQLDAIRFPARNEALDAHLARLRIRVAANVHFSVSVFMQYNSSQDAVSANVRARYNFSEGRDLWLVYNDGFNTERETAVGPRLPFSQGRTVMVKYSHTVVW